MDALIEAFGKYGVAGLAAFILILAILWAIAHVLAQPGRHVTVLFGLFKYVKRE